MGQTNFSGPVDSKAGFKVNGTTVINSNGQIVESAGIELADGDSFDDSNSNEMMEFEVTASAVNHIGIKNAATGNNPIILAKGESDTGLTFQSEDDEEMLILNAAAGAVNELTISSAAAGSKPSIAATGEADNGIEFHNDQSEEILILQSAATSVNELTVTSAATGSAPSLSATGDDADIDLALTAKGDGAVDLQGAVLMSETTTSSGPGAVAITGAIHEVTTTGTGDALTLADGTEGQRLAVVYVAEGAGGDTAVLTPTNLAGANTTITFNDLGDSADLLFTNGAWYFLGGEAAVA